jgi:type IV pilus assembly protein PilM
MISLSSLKLPKNLSSFAIPNLGKGKGVVGLDIGSSRIKVAEIKSVKGHYELANIAQIDLLPDTIVDGQIIDGNHVSDCISRIFTEQKIVGQQIATSLSGNAVIVKKIHLPIMGLEELRDQINWEAQQHIPFDIQDVNLDYHVLEGNAESEMMDVLLVACKKDMVTQLTRVIAQAGITTSIVDVDSFALQNAYEVNYIPRPDQTVVLLNVGASVTNINIVRGTSSIFTRDVSMGGNQYTDALQKKFNLTFEEAETLKRGTVPEGCTTTVDEALQVLQAVSEMLAGEIQRTLDFFHQQSPHGEKILGMLVAGGGSKVANLVAYLSERFQIYVEPFDPFRNLNVNPQKFDEQYLREFAPDMAVAVGLALRSDG